MTTTLPPKQFTTVNGHGLAHVEMGQGEPIVLLHGNAASSGMPDDGTARRCAESVPSPRNCPNRRA
jgi:pimeloyl-ACP methyl ester carboxylesterase